MEQLLERFNSIGNRTKFIIFIALFGLIAYSSYEEHVTPALVNFEASKEEDQKLESEITTITQSGQSIVVVEASLKEAEDTLTHLLESLPAEPDVERLLGNLAEIGKELNVEITKFEPQQARESAAAPIPTPIPQEPSPQASPTPSDSQSAPPELLNVPNSQSGQPNNATVATAGVIEEQIRITPVQVSLTGTFPQIVSFFDRVLDLPRIVRLESFTMERFVETGLPGQLLAGAVGNPGTIPNGYGTGLPGQPPTLLPPGVQPGLPGIAPQIGGAIPGFPQGGYPPTAYPQAGYPPGVVGGIPPGLFQFGGPGVLPQMPQSQLNGTSPKLKIDVTLLAFAQKTPFLLTQNDKANPAATEEDVPFPTAPPSLEKGYEEIKSITSDELPSIQLPPPDLPAPEEEAGDKPLYQPSVVVPESELRKDTNNSTEGPAENAASVPINNGNNGTNVSRQNGVNSNTSNQNSGNSNEAEGNTNASP